MIAINNDPDISGYKFKPVLKNKVNHDVKPPPSSLQYENDLLTVILGAFIASLFIPGSGHFMRRHYFMGSFYFACAVIVWLCSDSLNWLIVIVHVFAALNVLSYGYKRL